MLPKLFIGSSEEARDAGLLDALRLALDAGLNSPDPSIDLVPWPISPWKNMTVAVQALVENLVDYSYGVFILSADDKLSSRGCDYYVARDNVIFEFGLFLAHLGPERTFLVGPADTGKTIAMSAVKTALLDTTPPPELPLRILTDIGGAHRKGRYTVVNPGLSPTITFQVTDLSAAIKEVEAKTSGLTRLTASRELNRLLNGARADISKDGEGDAYYIGQVISRFRDIATLKARAGSKSVQNAVNDVMLAFERIPDLCEIGELANLQHHSQGVTEVWVFADDPLEFRAQTHPDPAYNALRRMITENLRSGVQYVYFVGPDFIASNVDHLVDQKDPDRETMLLGIHVVRVSSQLFSTYFTLHFKQNQQSPDAIYMSSVMNDRRDVLIQVSDSVHFQRIYYRMRILRGLIERKHSPSITRYVL